MFTVKWIVKTEVGEITRIFEARNVEVGYRNDYDPPSVASKSPPTPWYIHGRFVERALLVIDGDEAALTGHSFDVGTVYVMNEAGSTVGKYVLDDSIQPLSRHLSEVA